MLGLGLAIGWWNIEVSQVKYESYHESISFDFRFWIFDQREAAMRPWDLMLKTDWTLHLAVAVCRQNLDFG